MSIHTLLGVLLLLYGTATTIAFPIHPDTHNDITISRIAVGSCNRHNFEQPLWRNINNLTPDLFVWLGDVVYNDNIKRFPIIEFTTSPLHVIQSRYDAQKQIEGYKQLSKSTPIVGVWDDHDYGLNNAGKEYIYKNESKDIFLGFLDEPGDSVRRKRDGIYASYTFGSEGRKVKLILFDTRYFRDEPLLPGSDILGEEQWKWVDVELEKGEQENVNIYIFGSSIQFLPYDTPFIEKWGNFPGTRERLMRLFLKYNIQTPIIISGDVHHSEFFKYSCVGSPLEIFEMTTSGMTHCCSTQLPHSICRVMNSTLWRSKYSLGAHDGLNFGIVDIDWKVMPVTVTLTTYGVDGKVLQHMTARVRNEKSTSWALCKDDTPWIAKQKVRTGVLFVVVPVLFGLAVIIYQIFKWIKHYRSYKINNKSD